MPSFDHQCRMSSSRGEGGFSEWIFIDKQPIEEELFGIIGDIEVAVVVFSDLNKCG